MADRRLRVGGLFGGRSGEHEGSLQSARAVIAALDTAGHEVVPIGIDRAGHWLIGGDPLQALATGGPTAARTVSMLPEPGRRSLVAVAEDASRVALAGG